MSPLFEITLRLLVGLSFWVTTLLIAAVIVMHAAEWWSAAFPAAPMGWYQARVTAVADADPALARIEVDQVGRALLDSRQEGILFNDTVRRAIGFGGQVEFGQQVRTVVFAHAKPMLWLGLHSLERKISGDAFAECFAASKGSQGFKRTLQGNVCVGDWVWLRGQLRADQVLECDAVSVFAPSVLSLRNGGLLLLCAVLTVATAGAITWAALAGPADALQSKLAGGAGLAFFLLVQPFGVWARDYFALPDQSRIDGLVLKESLTAGASGR